MVGDLLRAEVDHVGDHDAALAGRLQVYVVHTDAVAHHSATARQALQDPTGDGRHVHQHHVGVPEVIDQFILVAALGGPKVGIHRRYLGQLMAEVRVMPCVGVDDQKSMGCVHGDRQP